MYQRKRFICSWAEGLGQINISQGIDHLFHYDQLIARFQAPPLRLMIMISPVTAYFVVPPISIEYFL
jgi:hypothetical protein